MRAKSHTLGCLGHWAAEHDMAEAGQLILAGCIWAEM